MMSNSKTITQYAPADGVSGSQSSYATPKRTMNMRDFLAKNAFTDPKAPKPDDDKPPEPVITPEDLANARQTGWNEGHAAAEQSLLVMQGNNLAEQMALLNTSFAGFTKSIDGAQVRFDAHAHAVGMAIIRKILPQYIAQHGAEEVRALISQTLAAQREKIQVTIHVAPSQRDSLSSQIDILKNNSSFQGNITIAEDSAMSEDDCRLSFADGTIERNSESLLAKIESILEENKI